MYGSFLKREHLFMTLLKVSLETNLITRFFYINLCRGDSIKICKINVTLALQKEEKDCMSRALSLVFLNG
jgi:hypothetical protein